MKLLKVERSLQIFDKKSEELIAEYPVNVELEPLRNIVKPIKNDDPLYRPYALSKVQVKKLLANMSLHLMIEMKTYHYFLDCSGIYDFESK
jgi:hypothetical protein